MAKKAKKAPAKTKPAKKSHAKALPPKLRDRALGKAADKLGKDVAPRGTEVAVATGKTVRALLKHLDMFVSGLDVATTWVEDEVSKRVRSFSVKSLVEPDPRIAVPVIQALSYSMGEEHIREMFANLLASDMVADRKKQVHPAFVEIIKQMTPDEAKILNFIVQHGPQAEFAALIGNHSGTTRVMWSEMSFEIPTISADDLIVGLSNLERLEVLTVSETDYPTGPVFAEIDKRIRTEMLAKKMNYAREFPNPKLIVDRRGIYLTPLGRRFASTCVTAPLGTAA